MHEGGEAQPAGGDRLGGQALEVNHPLESAPGQAGGHSVESHENA
jgi:hypothetical protein